MYGTLAPVFKLADLVKLYSARLEQLRVKQHDHTQSTHLKNRILARFSELPARKEGCRDALLAFNKDLRPALLEAFEHDYADEAICLAKAANIVFRDMLILEAPFTGSFDLDCQRTSVPHCFPALVGMVLRGPHIKVQGLGDASHKKQQVYHNCCSMINANKTKLFPCWRGHHLF